MKKLISKIILLISILSNTGYGLQTRPSKEPDFSPYFKMASELNNKKKASFGLYAGASSFTPAFNVSYEHDFNNTLSLEFGANFTIVQGLMSLEGPQGILLAFATGSYVSADYVFSSNYKKFRPYVGTHLNLVLPGVHTGFDAYLNDNKYININLSVDKNIHNPFTNKKIMPVLSASYGIKF